MTTKYKQSVIEEVNCIIKEKIPTGEKEVLEYIHRLCEQTSKVYGEIEKIDPAEWFENLDNPYNNAMKMLFARENESWKKWHEYEIQEGIRKANEKG